MVCGQTSPGEVPPGDPRTGERMLQEEPELVPAKRAVSKRGRYNPEFLPLSPLRAATATFSIRVTEGLFVEMQ